MVIQVVPRSPGASVLCVAVVGSRALLVVCCWSCWIGVCWFEDKNKFIALVVALLVGVVLYVSGLVGGLSASADIYVGMYTIGGMA